MGRRFHRLVLASNNTGKLQELTALLAPLSIKVLPQSAWRIPDAPEPHPTFVENALAKARHAAKLTGLPALSDDSGLCVDALSGAPGVRSARLAGEPSDDARNNAQLLHLMSGVAERSARYYCVLVLLRHQDDPQPLIAEGEWHGAILDAPRGDGGFGYDPLFWLADLHCTAAELPLAEKNRLSHRARAFNGLLARLNEP